MLTTIGVELTKLKRSLALVLCIAAPLFVALLAFLIGLDGNKPRPWAMFMASGSAMWAYFMLPMTVTALTVLVRAGGARAQGVERGSRAARAALADLRR